MKSVSLKKGVEAALEGIHRDLTSDNIKILNINVEDLLDFENNERWGRDWKIHIEWEEPKPIWKDKE